MTAPVTVEKPVATEGLPLVHLMCGPCTWTAVMVGRPFVTAYCGTMTPPQVPPGKYQHCAVCEEAEREKWPCPECGRVW